MSDMTIDMREAYRKDCEAGRHRIGQRAFDSGHGARPSGPQMCLNCEQTLDELFAAARQDEREKLRLAFRPLLVRPTMYFGDPIDKDQLLAEFDAAIDRLTPRKEDVT